MQSASGAGLKIGEEVGGYRIVERVGSGGTGALYLAEHRQIGRRAAVRVLPREWSASRDDVARFFDDARAASSLDHPGILQVLDSGFHARTGQAYLVLERLVGMSLRRRLDGGSRPAGQRWALRIARAIAEPVAAAHRRGIVHRDLEPGNVFLVEGGGGETVKVLGFGIARLARAAKGRALVGSPRYLSPEQCRGSATVDARADIYALGCMLFEMLCGRPPFTGAQAAELVAAHLTQAPPQVASLAPETSRGLSALVAMMLAKNPEKRPTSMTEVISLLDAVPPVADQRGTWAAASVGAARLETTAPLPGSARHAASRASRRSRERPERRPAPARRDSPAPSARSPERSRSGATGMTTANYWQPGRPRQLLLAVPLVAAAVLGVFLLRDKAAEEKRARAAEQAAAERAAAARPPERPAAPVRSLGLTPEDLAAAAAAAATPAPARKPAAAARPDAD
jgi:serine/threonine protein kinase